MGGWRGSKETEMRVYRHTTGYALHLHCFRHGTYNLALKSVFNRTQYSVLDGFV